MTRHPLDRVSLVLGLALLLLATVLLAASGGVPVATLVPVALVGVGVVGLATTVGGRSGAGRPGDPATRPTLPPDGDQPGPVDDLDDRALDDPDDGPVDDPVVRTRRA